MVTAQWIELDGTANARDVGGVPLIGGGVVRSSRLLRSDNLQDLTSADIHHLVDGLGLRTVIDLRTQMEVESTGDGPILKEPLVSVRHLSLLSDWPKKAERNEEILPTQAATSTDKSTPRSYTKYLEHRPENVVEALRVIAGPEGATLVHCAAGKDRTGVIIAMALSEVGAQREAIIDDYVGDPERIRRVLARLAESPTYDWVTKAADLSRQIPTAKTIAAFLDHLDAEHGGTGRWLRGHGWTDADGAALRHQLVG